MSSLWLFLFLLYFFIDIFLYFYVFFYVQKVIESLTEDYPLFEMSTLTGEGVVELRNEACNRLLACRVEAKLKGKKATGILNCLQVAEPKPRDDKVSLYLSIYAPSIFNFWYRRF